MKTAKEPKLVVGVGASAGGLEAFKELLSVLPSNSGMAFLLVQHLDPTHESLLGELLAPLTRMIVREADQGVRLQPNTVFIIQPDTALAVENGRIELTPPTLHRGVRLPVNHLFSSLAKQCGSRSVGIVLSGAGSDGSAGVREIKAAGGLVIAQRPSSCGQSGMPQSTIETGVADLVIDIAEIPAALERFAELPPLTRAEPTTPPEDSRSDSADARVERLADLTAEEIGRLAAVLDAQIGFDLRVYKPTTVERRVLRRMALSGYESIDPYLEHLREIPSEQMTLLRDLLISVTEFFRDPEAFKVLREIVIDPIVTRTTAGDTIRVWVPACATGEEAYSIAMEFLDAIDVQGKRLNLQVFATDVDESALGVARSAIYPPTIAEQISQHRLQAYFKPLERTGFQVRAALRDVVSFAVHDLTKDPPFSRMNLVSCRNVLIYLTPVAQKHVLKVLHFALEPKGQLFLSTSESTGPQLELFTTESKTHRIYSKRGTSRHVDVPRSRSNHKQEADSAPRTKPEALPNRRARGIGEAAQRAVLDVLVPPTLVVSEDGSILFSHGELGPYLQIPRGEFPRFELNSVLRSELATRVRGALYKSRRSNETVVVQSSPDKALGQVRITAQPVCAQGDDATILTFEALPRDELASPRVRPDNAEHEALVVQLEKELQATREDLRTTVEELETSNEELRSSNEESMSMNEELQSANEELEATTEELRSLNEELTTVNSQLREKVEQLEAAHDDLNNFFSSTKIATVFLDDRLCIKRYTPAARTVLGIDHADTGRYVGDIARELLQNDLSREARRVLENLTPCYRELQTEDGRWITRQILPYRTEARRIEGVVVTFSDITEFRSANEALASKTQRLELAWEVAKGGLFEHSVPFGDTSYFSEQWAQILGWTRADLPPDSRIEHWFKDQIHHHDQARFEATLAEFIASRDDQYHIELRVRHRLTEQWRWVRIISRALARDEAERVTHLLGMMMDITDLEQIEEELRRSESHFREMSDGLPLIVWVHGAGGEQEFVNKTFCEFFGVDRDDMKGGRWQMLMHPDEASEYSEEFLRCVREQRPFQGEVRVENHAGEWRWLASWGKPRFDAAGEFCGLVGTSADVTERRNLEIALRENEFRFRLAQEAAQLGIHDYDLRTNKIKWDSRTRELWGIAADVDVTYDTFLQGVHTEDREQLDLAIQKATSSDGEQLRTQFRVVQSRTDEVRWIECAGKTHFEDGRAVRLIGTMEDITARKRADQARAQLAAIVESSDDAIIGKTLDRIITVAVRVI